MSSDFDVGSREDSECTAVRLFLCDGRFDLYRPSGMRRDSLVCRELVESHHLLHRRLHLAHSAVSLRSGQHQFVCRSEFQFDELHVDEEGGVGRVQPFLISVEFRYRDGERFFCLCSARFGIVDKGLELVEMLLPTSPFRLSEISRLVGRGDLLGSSLELFVECARHLLLLCCGCGCGCLAGLSVLVCLRGPPQRHRRLLLRRLHRRHGVARLCGGDLARSHCLCRRVFRCLLLLYRRLCRLFERGDRLTQVLGDSATVRLDFVECLCERRLSRETVGYPLFQLDSSRQSRRRLFSRCLELALQLTHAALQCGLQTRPLLAGCNEFVSRRLCRLLRGLGTFEHDLELLLCSRGFSRCLRGHLRLCLRVVVGLLGERLHRLRLLPCELVSLRFECPNTRLMFLQLLIELRHLLGDVAALSCFHSELAHQRGAFLTQRTLPLSRVLELFLEKSLSRPKTLHLGL
mmetsp:Transcript_13055/g.30826  ORF Transcript_13055/g.30826 Transcript_13055/m.30826 type:complete len:462 (+) Transcript_13055:544-1929(+)